MTSSPDALIDQLQLSRAAQGLWQPGLPLAQFAARLEQKGLHADALQVVPHLTDKRRAIWWACLCCWEVMRPETSPAASLSLGVAVNWILAPSENTRLAAQPAAKASGKGTPEGCLAHAVLWSAGSLADPKLPVVPPPEHVTGVMVGMAVLLAAIVRGPEQTPPLHKQFLSLAHDVRAGRHLWTDQP